MITSDPSLGGNRENVIFSSVNFGLSRNLLIDNVTMAGGMIEGPNIHLHTVIETSPLCVKSAGVVIDGADFGSLGQSCNEGRLGITTGASGTIVRNSTFGPGGASDGIQITGGPSGTHIGPNNTFKEIVEELCGSVHCDAIQLYGASNTTVDSNWFYYDSTIVMSPDCNGTPLTFTNNVVNQQAGSAAAALTIGGANGDVYSHNTMVNGSFRIYGGNPGNCSTKATVADNLTSMTGVKFVGGASPTTWAGYALATGSAGKGAGTGGTDLGILVSGTPTPVPTPTPTPTPTPVPISTRIKVTSTANIRQAPTSNTVLPGLYATEPAGALGTVLVTSPFGYPPKGVPNWVEVKFDTCVAAIPNCTGWMGSDNMTVVTTPPPPTPTSSMTTLCSFLTGGTVWRCDTSTVNIPTGTAIKSVVTSGTLTNTTNGILP
jgi:hypothetical protein